MPVFSDRGLIKRIPMPKYLALLPLFALTACGGFKWWNEAPDKARIVASSSLQQFTAMEKEGFKDLLEERFHSLHSYYVIGQKNLDLFDALIENQATTKIYESGPYLNLLAVKSQTEEIEHELADLYRELSQDKNSQNLKQRFEVQLRQFSKKSSLRSRSVENLRYKLGLVDSSEKSIVISKRELEIELESLQKDHEFIVYEKNIEHLSHMLDVKIEGQEKSFFPSVGKAGNLSGNEFPAKVWSLTFDDGPGKNTTLEILESLKERKMKATFFQLAQQAKANVTVAKAIRDAGMEIASHSYTHQQLTKVSSLALDKEITIATRELSELHKREIKFFRLPYGAGVNSPAIREKIAASKLIHVFWNIDTLDWMAQEPSRIVKRARDLMAKTPKDAGVILFHDIHVRTTQAAPLIMDELKKDGRRVCTLDEIVTDINEGAETVCPTK